MLKDNKPLWFHFRRKDTNGEIDNMGGATVCIVPHGDEAYYGVSTCSLLDNFEKKKGRVKSHGRANSRRWKIDPPHDLNEAFLVAKEIAQNEWDCTPNSDYVSADELFAPR